MKKVLFLALVAIAVVFSSCKEDVYTQINPIAKACFAPGGNNTYYEYFDGRATNPDDRNFTVTVSSYGENPFACDQKKTYRSSISYKLGDKDCMVSSNSCTENNTAYVEIAIPHSEVLYLECDAAGNFNCQKHDYLPTYEVNGVTYEKVHYFEVVRGSDLYHYYFAENVGLIYMNDDQQKVQLKLTGVELH